MNARVNVEPLDHSLASTAEQVHAVQMAAYAREAELIGSTDFFPLSRTVHDLLVSPGQFFGGYIDDHLVGAVGVESGAEDRIGILSLVVLPQWHRRGVGRTLLQHIVNLHGEKELQVQTTALNSPALSLYRLCGFVEALRWSVGTPPLQLVAFRRASSGAQNVA